MAAAPASALELGELKVHSTLGQPLRASIAYALGPNEALSNTCVTLQRVRGSNLPSIGTGAVTIANGVITVAGNSIVREPMVSLRLTIRCHYTPWLMRDFMVLVDPTVINSAPVDAPTADRIAARPTLIAPPLTRSAPAAPQRPPSRDPIAAGSQYLVQPGDSLSRIAQRVDNAPGGLADTANAIFAANPDAFIDNDPNRIKAGSWLTISVSDGWAAAAVADAPQPYEPAAADSSQPPVTGTVYDPEKTVDFSSPDEHVQIVEPVEISEPAEPVAEILEEIPEPAALQPQNELRPGDIIVEPTISIPDTRLEGPQTTANAPNAAYSIIRQPAKPETAETNWLLWLGSGAAVVVALMLAFGRRLRDRFGSKPIAPAAAKAQSEPREAPPVEAISDVDIDISDDSPTAENLALDADLIMGTGLSETADVDVASDFAFAATTELDLELTKEMAEDTDQPETDIIPPIGADESGILKNEVLPEDDDYDMSVIIDATKMPDPSDVTERDLEAVAVEDNDETLITDDYTVSQDADYKVLEQDYEDELTATQALNAEIQKAAEDLAVNLDAAQTTLNETGINPTGSLDGLDVTAQMPANDDEHIGDNDDTGVNPTINIDSADDTVEMPNKGKKTG